MFIQVEGTPNPKTMRFLTEQELLAQGTREYKSLEEAANSPLAQELLKIEVAEGVLVGRDFISVTLNDAALWETLEPKFIEIITDFMQSGRKVFTDQEVDEKKTFDDPIEQQIYEIIETRVRPSVAMDGGDIVYAGFDQGIVYLHMKGACSGCPSSMVTLKNGIENMLKHFVPEVQAVEASQL